jgi:hypothetical protein
LPRFSGTDATLSDFQELPQHLPSVHVGGMLAAGNRAIYILGGDNVPPGEEVALAFLQANGEPGQFASGSPLTAPRAYGAAIATDHYLYAVGGLDRYGTTASIERAPLSADGVPGTFEMLASSLTAPRDGAAYVRIGDYLYLFSGYRPGRDGSSSKGLTPTVERAPVNADGSLGAFIVVGTTINKPRSGASAVIVGNHVYVVNGIDANGQVPPVERAIISADRSVGPFVVEKSPYIEFRGFSPVVTVGNQIVVLGGRSDSKGVTLEAAKVGADGSLGPFALLPAKLTRPHELGVAFLAGNGLFYASGSAFNTLYDTVERSVVSSSG